MAKPTLFFTKARIPAVKKMKVFGGRQKDALYSVFVLSVLDNFLKNPKGNQAIFNSLMDAHIKNFPNEFSMIQQSKTPGSLIHYLKIITLKDKLINQFSFSVKQASETYARKHLEEITTIRAEFPHQDSKLIELSHCFKVPIDLKIISQDKDLFLREVYHPGPFCSEKITLSYASDRATYYAEVYDYELFKKEKQYNSEIGILAHKQIKEKYKQNVRGFMALYGKKINNDFLIDLYIKNLFLVKKAKEELKSFNLDSDIRQKSFENDFEHAFGMELIYSLSYVLNVNTLMEENYSLPQTVL